MPVGVGVPVEASTTLAVKVTFALGVMLRGGDLGRGGRGQSGGRQHLDRTHHAGIFVLQDVAVIDEGADNIRIAEIHAQLHARIRSAAAPERQIDGIANGRIVHRLAIDFEHLKVNLMDVEDVIFQRRILHHPVFDRARMHNDVGRVVHVEQGGLLSLFGDEEVRRAIWVGGILQHF